MNEDWDAAADAFLAETSSAPPEDADPLDVAAGEFLAEQEQQQRQATHATALSTRDTNPEHMAEALQLEKSTGLPAEIIATNIDDVRFKQRLKNLDDLNRDSPALARMMREPRFAAIAQDDLMAMKQAERLVKSEGFKPASEFLRGEQDANERMRSGPPRPQRPTLAQALARVNTRLQMFGYGESPDTLPGAPREDPFKIFSNEPVSDYRAPPRLAGEVGRSVVALPLYDAPAALFSAGAATLDQIVAGGPAGSLLGPAGMATASYLGLGGDNDFVQGIADFMRRTAQHINTKREDFIGMPRDAGFGEKALVHGLGSAAQTLMVLAATRNPQATVAILGALSGAREYPDAYDKLGAGKALPYATAMGFVEWASELPLLGAIKALKMGSPMGQMLIDYAVKEQFGEQFAAHVGDAVRQSALEPDKTWGEYWAERPEVAINTMAATLVATIAQGSLLRGVMALGERQEKSVRAAAHAELLQSVAKAAQATKTLQRSPEHLQQFIDEATADGPLNEIYVDGALLEDVLRQSGITAPASIEEQLPSVTGTGGYVMMTPGEFASTLSAPEVFSKIKDHLKVNNPNDFSVEEAKSFMQSAQADVERVVAQHDDAFRKSSENLSQNLTQRLTSIGRFRENVASAYVTGSLSAFYTQMASRLRKSGQAEFAAITPEGVYKIFPIEFSGEKAAGAALDQDPLAAMDPEERVEREKLVEALHDAQDDDDTRGSGRIADVLVDAENALAEFDNAHGIESDDEGNIVGGTALYQLNFDQPAGQFNEPDFRPAVVAWAKERFGDTVAPNGRPAWQNFVAWFGDSKVTDKSGAPLVVYHGTKDDFEEFQRGLGSRKDSGWLGEGFYFMSEPALASEYASRLKGGSGAPRVMPVYLSIKNPYYAKLSDKEPVMLAEHRVRQGRGSEEDRRAAQDFREKLIAAGYDGVILDYGKTGKEVVAFHGPQIKSTGNRGTFDPNDPNILQQAAFHGSPHDFDRFSLGKVGTGEGAAAYGWGLYFAENPAVAAGYHKNLADAAPIEEMRLGTLVLNERNQFDYARRASESDVENVRASLAEDLMIEDLDLRAAGVGGFPAHVLKVLDDRIANYYDAERDQKMIAAAKELRRRLEKPGALSIRWGKSSGGIYQVDIADEATARMLDWDAPLSEQPASVREALVPLLAKIAAMPDKNGPVDRARDSVANGSATGETLYNRLTYLFGKPGAFPEIKTPDQEAASKALLAAGIPGIRYLDQGSRTTISSLTQQQVEQRLSILRDDLARSQETGEGDPARMQAQIESLERDLASFTNQTRNIVVFDESIITLTHKDGTPVTSAERQSFLQEAKGGLSQPDGSGKAPPRAGYTPRSISADNIARLTLTPNADLSSALHEFGHHYLEVLTHFAQQGVPGLQQDMNTFLKWAGVHGETDEERMQTWVALGEEVARRRAAGRTDLIPEEMRAAHEKFAEGFEVYLWEGKAPSIELRGLFQRFKDFLLDAYKRIRPYPDVKLSDEVRSVFDRLLASDEQIREAQVARGMLPLLDQEQAEALGLEWAKYQLDAEAATQEAIDKLQTRSLRDMQWLAKARGKKLKELQAANADKRATMRSAVMVDVKRRQVYAVMEFLKRGVGIGPDGNEINSATMLGVHKLNTDDVKTFYEDVVGAPDWSRLGRGKYGMLSKEGMPPDAVASMYGYRSGDEMIRDILAAEPVNDVIERETDRRMIEEHGDLTTPAALERAVNEALHNQARARFVSTELGAMAEALAPKGKTKAGGSYNMLLRAAKEMAARIISGKRIRDLRPHQYQADAQRAGNAAATAQRAGKTLQAINEKKNQLVGIQTARAATDAQEEVERGIKYLRRFQNEGTRKNIEHNFRDQIDKLLERFDLRRISNKAADKRATLAGWIEHQEQQGLVPNISPALRDETLTKPYRDMTVEEFRGLVESIKNIEHLGRLKHKLLLAKDKREFNEIIDAMVDGIEANATRIVPRERETDRGWLVSPARGVRRFFSAHRKFASYAAEMDGHKDGGVVWEHLVRTMNERATYQTVENEKATKKLVEIFARLHRKGASELGKRVYTGAHGRTYSREEVIGLLLNLGNETNIERVLSGEKGDNGEQTFGALQDVLTLVGQLDATDAAIANEVWEYLDSFRPAMEAKQLALTGTKPQWVEAKSFKLTLRDGTVVDMRGGYYPIAYDRYQDVKTTQMSRADLLKQIERGAVVSSTTQRGHLEERVKSTGRPLTLAFGRVLSVHVEHVIHDLAWHEYLVDANRMLKSEKLKAAIVKHHGQEPYRQMTRMLEDIAVGGLAHTDDLAPIIDYARYGTTIVGLGWNISNTLINLTGITQSIVRIGPAAMLKGMSHWAGDIKNGKAFEAVYAKSEMMRLRAVTMHRELNELMNKVEGKEQKLLATYFWLQVQTQKIVDIPTWWGAYEKAMEEENMSEAKAVQLADQAVLDAQGGGQIKDLSGVQRGGSGMKLFTAFYHFFNTTWNLTARSYQRTDFKKPGDVALFTADMVLLYTIPATLGAIIKMILGDFDWGDEDELRKRLLRENISYMLAPLVLARELTSGVQDFFGVSAGYGYSGPAGMRFLSEFAKLAKQAGQIREDGFDAVDAAFLKSLNNVAGMGLHYPAGAINRFLEGAYALYEGETRDPRVLITGPQQQ